MKRTLFGTILLAAALPALAQYENKIDATFRLDYSSADVWRGINLVDDPVFTPSLSLSFENWRAFLLARMELSNLNSYPLNANPSREFTAMRGGLFYTFDYDSEAPVTLGILTHQFPSVGVPQTHELYYSMAFGGVGNFKIEVMQDVEQVKGYYVRASGSHLFKGGFRRPDGTDQPIQIGAHFAYGDNKFNSNYYGAVTSTLSDLSVWATTSFEISPMASINPYLVYAALIDPDLLQGSPNRTNFYYGVSAAFRF
ncbi:MAG: hypothetical protein IH945_00545 [Armatimonadetes bacterium]|nr:hypothetical protein [Armatimonadota bacterium]